MSKYVKRGTLVIDKETNKKMYPVGKWNTYSHVFYNYNDRCFNNMTEQNTEKNYEQFETAERLLELFETNPRVNDIVYAYYEDYRKMRDVIEAYVFRHGGRI